MPVRQLSIFLENRKGRLETVAKILADKQINIRGLSVADTAEFGILRLIVEKVDAAEAALREAGVVLHINEVTAVEVDHQPGGLAKVLALLNGADINVEYMYALAQPESANPVMILRFDDPKTAREALKNGGCKLLNEADMAI
jgi:hypothetical protein